MNSLKNPIISGKEILRRLIDNGYDAYFVGGFVRDFLLSIESSDIDLTTSAKPEEIKVLFPNAISTGERYGTLTIPFEGSLFEVTTFRTEGEYLDARHPKFVAYTLDLSEDLKRRDFTINALAMDINGRIIDQFNGQKDLEAKIIRAIGDPDTRFKEDALRMMRAFRFVSKLGFEIEPKTFESISRNKALLIEIANERIMQELKLILSGKHVLKALKLMHKAEIESVLKPMMSGLVWIEHQTEYHLSYLEFFALSFYLNNREFPEEWRFSNHDRTIIERLMDLVTVTQNEPFNELLVYVNGLELSLMANRISNALDPTRDQSILINKLYQQMPIHKTCDLSFKGQDILMLELVKDARIIGDLIDDITYQVITLQIPNTYEAIKDFVINKLKNGTTTGANHGK